MTTLPATIALAIARVLSIHDSREYELVADRWHPIPGTGESRRCARCGRLHVVHAEVELSDGTRAVLGTACAARASMELAPALRKGEATARKVAQDRALVARLERLITERDAIEAAVSALPVPPVVESRVVLDEHRADLRLSDGIARHWHYACGDGWSYTAGYQPRDEGRERAVAMWRQARRVERGWTADHRYPEGELRHAKARLAGHGAV